MDQGDPVATNWQNIATSLMLTGSTVKAAYSPAGLVTGGGTTTAFMSLAYV
jgi:hypothetical protein